MKTLCSYVPLFFFTAFALSFLSLSPVFETAKLSDVAVDAGELLVTEMITVPGGTFRMGDNFGDGGLNEKPAHMVTISTFEIGKYELTFAEYDRFCSSTSRPLPRDERWGRDQMPVINVSWYDAVAYCNWRSEQEGYTKVYRVEIEKAFDGSDEKVFYADWQANGYRLPTEAEWEYAASWSNSSEKTTRRTIRASERYAGTSSEHLLDDYANFCDANCSFRWKTTPRDDGYAHTAPVGQFLPNELGVYDMSGNVWEWCWDYFDEDYYKDSPKEDPRGSNIGGYRIVRGGSWRNLQPEVRCAYRQEKSPGRGNFNTGFRLARTVN
ncbi:formylglycine-generating enzyme family protein [Lewinella sp. LCG006]|uniref:formylglycine-generating enzyme family protein n=1 Tax=Lewinella sp. LCG006 TaxID=3231911 RepID=UPI003460BFDA